MSALAQRQEQLEYEEYWEMADIAANQVHKTERKLDLDKFTNKVEKRTTSWHHKRSQWEAGMTKPVN